MRKVGMHAAYAAENDGIKNAGDMKKKLAEAKKENKQLRAENQELRAENEKLAERIGLLMESGSEEDGKQQGGK